MKVLIIGAGRMGLRHAQGAIQAKHVAQVCLTDIADSSLEKAATQFPDFIKAGKLSLEKPESVKGDYEFVIVASTAGNRLETCINVLLHNPKFILLEKPLGQSYQEVVQLVDFFKDKGVKAYVNLNMRMYEFVKELKNDLTTLPQFQGVTSINYIGGAMGIGANGIHYLDLLFHLFAAENAVITAGEIDQEMIPSGRGPQFGDFGGWARIEFLDKQGVLSGKSILSLSSTSTVFGGWEIIGSHGRIRINELESQRVDILRDHKSILPMNRYGAEYSPPVVRAIESPLLGNLTQQWIDGMIEGRETLPGLGESLKSHRLMFDWLSLSKTHKNTFPIT